MQNRIIIGIGGGAGFGKSFFAEKIAQYAGRKTVILPLADPLKEDVRPFILEKFGIDILNCTREEKDLVRPILLAVGKINRKISNGTCYTKKVEARPEFNSDSIVVIPDARYIETNEDEYYWLKKHGGKLIYIERAGIDYPNEDERINCPKLKAVADFVFEPPYFGPENEKECEEYFRGVLNQILV
jgi:hypothetical protein